jgi:hypothetical protein
MHDTDNRRTLLTRPLSNALTLISKARAFAAAEALTDAAVLGWRLAPDMFDFGRQMVVAADGARGAAARLAGVDPEPADDPAHAVFNRGGDRDFHEPATLAGLGRYVQDAIEGLERIAPDRLDGPADRPIVVAMGGRTRIFEAGPFLDAYVLPNLHFHVSIAYAILRHHGVGLGKADYEGPPVYVSGFA